MDMDSDRIEAADLINAFQAQWPKEFELTLLRLQNQRLQAYLADDVVEPEVDDG